VQRFVRVAEVTGVRRALLGLPPVRSLAVLLAQPCETGHGLHVLATSQKYTDLREPVFDIQTIIVGVE
jgi:hypothetical protein